MARRDHEYHNKIGVSVSAASVAGTVVASASAEEDSLMAAASAAEGDSSSISISYKQPAKPIIVTAVTTKKHG